MYIYIYQNILYVHIHGLVYTCIQVYLVLLYFVLSCTGDNIFFTNLRFAVTLRQTSLLALLAHFNCVAFLVILTIFQTLKIIIIFAMVICGQ